ncbi:MAG TPA: hypothetical protein VM925_29430 [Labilithrix sp.]|jgi:hypothetical protein|nr:hypothetical protein [Labilithrix sp.]
MAIRTIAFGLGSLVVAFGAGGCMGDDKIESVIPGVATGKLEQSWTIEGTKDVTKCEQYKAGLMRTVVLDSKGAVHATELAPCKEFRKTLDLKTDTYSANATFVDGAGNPVSKTLPIAPFTILEDKTVQVSVDFKAPDMKP